MLERSFVSRISVRANVSVRKAPATRAPLANDSYRKLSLVRLYPSNGARLYVACCRLRMHVGWLVDHDMRAVTGRSCILLRGRCSLHVLSFFIQLTNIYRGEESRPTRGSHDVWKVYLAVYRQLEARWSPKTLIHAYTCACTCISISIYLYICLRDVALYRKKERPFHVFGCTDTPPSVILLAQQSRDESYSFQHMCDYT